MIPGATSLIFQMDSYRRLDQSFTAVGCPVVHARLAITRFAILSAGISFGSALDFTGVFCRCLIHLLLLSFGLDVELCVGSLFVEVLFGHGGLSFIRI